MAGTMRFVLKPDPAVQAAVNTALEIQDACNSMAVANAMHRHWRAIADEARTNGSGLGTSGLNQHPAIILFLDKLNSLAKIQELGNEIVSKAYTACYELQDGRDVEWEVTLFD